MPLARFQTNFTSPEIDEVAGIIKGCRIATLGAVSKAAEGQGRGLILDSETITGLLRLAKDNGDRLPAFFTHEWYEDDTDGLNHDAGVWKDFAIDGNGNLTATFNAFETPYKCGIFSRAKTDPEGIAISPLFDYSYRNVSETLCTPTRFLSSDFVKRGAVNNALFSEATQNPTMDINELITLLDDPKCKDAIKAIVKSHQDTAAESDAATMEADAGVSDADKKDEDKQKPAMMRASLRIARMTKRVLGELKTEKTALLAAAKLEGEAGATALLGKAKITQNNGNGGDSKDEVETALAPYVAAAPNRGTAILRFAKDKPAEYNTFRKAGKI